LQSKELTLHWQFIEAENNELIQQGNALKEEAIYLRTRKRTLSKVLEGESSSGREKAAKNPDIFSGSLSC
jgi:hypothetical protein